MPEGTTSPGWISQPMTGSRQRPVVGLGAPLEQTQVPSSWHLPRRLEMAGLSLQVWSWPGVQTPVIAPPSVTGHAISVQATPAFEHEQLLHPSLAGKVTPSR